MPYKHGVTGSIPVVPTISPAAIKVTLRKKKHGPVVQLVRTPACHAGGRRFEPVLGRQGMQKCPFYASVAQLVEQRTENPRVVGSIPTGGTTPSDDYSSDGASLKSFHICGHSSFGRAPPCQGGGSEFESRCPLQCRSQAA